MHKPKYVFEFVSIFSPKCKSPKSPYISSFSRSFKFPSLIFLPTTRLECRMLNHPNTESEVLEVSIECDDVIRHVTLICQIFSNRIFLVITECESFGTLINITKDSVNQPFSEPTSVKCATEVLFGVNEPLYKVLAQKVGMEVFRWSSLPVLLSISLKNRTPTLLNPLMDGVKKLKLINGG